MDTLQQAPALWYWSEPASGYSIEDCEQIVAEEMQTAQPDPKFRPPWGYIDMSPYGKKEISRLNG